MERKAILMELIEGCKSLRQLIDGTLLSRMDKLHIMHEVTVGMGHVHSYGLVHKDLKPANVLCSADPSGFQVKVSDFGISSLAGGDRSIGPLKDCHSWAYSAPEFETASRLTTSVDVWSFGNMLVEVFGGAPWTDGGQSLQPKQIKILKDRYASKEPGEWKVHLLEMLPRLKDLSQEDHSIRDLAQSALHPVPGKRPTFRVCEEKLKSFIHAYDFRTLHGDRSTVYHALELGDFLFKTGKGGGGFALSRICDAESEAAGRDLKHHVDHGSERFYCSPYISCSVRFDFCLHYFLLQKLDMDFSGVILQIDVMKAIEGQEKVKLKDLSNKVLAETHLGASDEKFLMAVNRSGLLAQRRW